MTGAAEAGPAVDIVIESPLWNTIVVDSMLRRAIAAAAPADVANAELSIVLTDDAAIRELNRQWRGRDEATNVLSFPAVNAAAGAAPLLLGDIVIAYETTAREAESEGKLFPHHLAHLAVHGFLHLLGYDHESDVEAEEMERLEREILGRLDIADPYATRDTEA